MLRGNVPVQPEAPGGSPREVDEALQKATRIVYQLTSDERFLGECASQGVRPDLDTGSRFYWSALSDTASAIAARHRKTGRDCLVLSAIELLAATPAFVHVLPDLENPHASNEEKWESRYRAVAYNGMIRRLARPSPDQSANVMSKHMLNIVNISIENRRLRQAGAQEVGNRIAGAQHEIGFGQILAHTGRRFAHGSGEDDVHGTDYVVEGIGGGHHSIDVKGSLRWVTGRGSKDTGYLVRQDGTLVMASMIRQSEFEDSFQIPTKDAQHKAARLNQILDFIARGSSIPVASW